MEDQPDEEVAVEEEAVAEEVNPLREERIRKSHEEELAAERDLHNRMRLGGMQMQQERPGEEVVEEQVEETTKETSEETTEEAGGEPETQDTSVKEPQN